MFTQAHLRPRKRMYLCFLWKSDLYKARTPPPPRKASFVKQGLPLVQELSFLFFKWVGVGDIAVLDTEPKTSCT